MNKKKQQKKPPPPLIKTVSLPVILDEMEANIRAAAEAARRAEEASKRAGEVAKLTMQASADAEKMAEEARKAGETAAKEATVAAAEVAAKAEKAVKEALELNEKLTKQATDAGSSDKIIIPFTLVKDTRGYIEIVVRQINGCFQNGWHDACAVMIRRLIETLIIETFEKYGIESTIKDRDGNYLFLSELIPKTLNEPRWNLSRNTKGVLPKLKKLCDQSAHNRRFNAHKVDIDKIADSLRVAVQELLNLANLTSTA